MADYLHFEFFTYGPNQKNQPKTPHRAGAGLPAPAVSPKFLMKQNKPTKPTILYPVDFIRFGEFEKSKLTINM